MRSGTALPWQPGCEAGQVETCSGHPASSGRPADIHALKGLCC